MRESGFYWTQFEGFDETPEVAYYDQKKDIWIRTGKSAHYHPADLLRVGIKIPPAKFDKELLKVKCSCGKILYTRKTTQKFCPQCSSKKHPVCVWCGKKAPEHVYYEGKVYHDGCLEQKVGQ